MKKEYDEKFERVCSLKDRLLSLVEVQLAGDVSMVDAKELGEVVDMAKDMAELNKYCMEAKKLCEETQYYKSITEAMDDTEDPEYYMDKYLPEYNSKAKHYSPIRMSRPMSGRRYMYTNQRMHDDDYNDWEMPYHERMYYTPNTHVNMPTHQDVSKEGKSWMARRTYMDMKDSDDKNARMKEFENYIHELGDDIAAMVNGLDANEKATVKQKITGLASRIS